MQILSYNPKEDTFFIGLSEGEFDELANCFTIEYGFPGDEPYDEKENRRIAKEIATKDFKDPVYVEMLKETYNIENPPFICVVVGRDIKQIGIVPSHFPFANLRNGYSPWKEIKVQYISDIKDLKDIFFNIIDN